MALVLAGSPVIARMPHPDAIDSLVARVRHKRNALRARATSIALLLLVTDYPLKPVRPEQLAVPRAKAHASDWMRACQQRLVTGLERSPCPVGNRAG